MRQGTTSRAFWCSRPGPRRYPSWSGGWGDRRATSTFVGYQLGGSAYCLMIDKGRLAAHGERRREVQQRPRTEARRGHGPRPSEPRGGASKLAEPEIGGPGGAVVLRSSAAATPPPDAAPSPRSPPARHRGSNADARQFPSIAGATMLGYLEQF